MGQIIDGKAIATQLKAQIAETIKGLGFQPSLAVVLLGDDPASQVYVRNKTRACQVVGVRSVEHLLPASTTQDELLVLIAKLNTDASINGILIQLPLPVHIREEEVIAAINPDKDVDGFHPLNIGRFYAGLPCFVPCTAAGGLMLIKSVMPEIAGQRALVVGRSAIVGRPMSHLLVCENATVTIAHSHTQNIVEECSRADILVAALGKPAFIKGAWIKPGAVVIDVGINRTTKPDGSTKLIGDVDFNDVAMRAGAVTPVPGGVGPMTVACLMDNVLTAAKRQKGL